MKGKMSDYRLSRRDLLRSATLGAGVLGISALVTACGGSGHGEGSTGTAAAGSLRALAAGATQLSLLGVQGEGSPLPVRSEEHTSELQSRGHLVCRLLL